tara:strand:- start:3663 stop:3878 length:216 start_codon:yes stop_codon:yes gene_type:complete
LCAEENIGPEASASEAAAPAALTLASFAAGWLAGAAGTAVGYPLDNIKSHAQVKPIASLACTPRLFHRAEL